MNRWAPFISLFFFACGSDTTTDAGTAPLNCASGGGGCVCSADRRDELTECSAAQFQTGICCQAAQVCSCADLACGESSESSLCTCTFREVIAVQGYSEVPSCTRTYCCISKQPYERGGTCICTDSIECSASEQQVPSCDPALTKFCGNAEEVTECR